MFTTFVIGDMKATMLSDGPLRLDPPGEIFRPLDCPAFGAEMQAAGLPTDHVRVEQNCLLLETGGKRVLFDNGMGTAKPYGPDSGKLMASLAEAGIQPSSIDALVLTHGHSDHCWGTVADDGLPNFPNAVLYISQEEVAFWDADPPLERHLPSLQGARRHILSLRDRIICPRDNEEFLPGVQAWLTPGHTPGHTAFLLKGGWCLTGDVAFHDPLSFTFPDAISVYDTDRVLAVQTRRHVLNRLADERLRVIGYHQPWPGLGRIERIGERFRFAPSND